MMSKNLFFNLQKEDLKRRIWTIALFMLAFFLAFPLICALELSDTYYTRENINRNLLTFLGPNNEFVIFLTVLFAIICGLSSFYFLHSKKKVDLFHSLPIRREFMFAVNYVNGFLIFIIPYIINVIVCYVIIAINKYMSVEIFLSSIKTIAISSIFFLLIYTIVVIAVMLTGNLVVSFLGSGVFLLYGTMLIFLKEIYYSQFFSTYNGRNDTTTLLKVISPINIYYEITRSDEFPAFRLFKVLLVTIALIVLAIYFYKKRPSEAAGKAMAFTISKPIIKYLIVVPVSLAGGIFFKNISRSGNTGWFVFGLIFFTIISSVIIEMIYNFDVKSAFKQKKLMLITAATVGIIASVFHFDLIKYDEYLPAKSELASMSIAVQGFDSNLNSYNSNMNGYGYIDSIDYQLDNMELKDMEIAHKLAEMGVDYNYNNDYYDSNSIQYTIKYTLDNGREVYRQYSAKKDEAYDLLKNLYENEEYKEGHFPIYKTKVTDITTVEVNYMENTTGFNLSDTDKAELISRLKEDLNNITLEDMINNIPIATIIIGNGRHSTNYYINEKYTNTIEFLKNHGYDATNNIIDVDKIDKIVANNHGYVADVGEEVVYETKYNEKYGYDSKAYSLTKTYTDKEDINELISNFVQDEYYWNNGSVIQIAQNLEFTVYLKNENNSEYSTTRIFFLLSDQIPDFIREDLQYK